MKATLSRRWAKSLITKNQISFDILKMNTIDEYLSTTHKLDATIVKAAFYSTHAGSKPFLIIYANAIVNHRNVTYRFKIIQPWIPNTSSLSELINGRIVGMANFSSCISDGRFTLVARYLRVIKESGHKCNPQSESLDLVNRWLYDENRRIFSTNEKTYHIARFKESKGAMELCL